MNSFDRFAFAVAFSVLVASASGQMCESWATEPGTGGPTNVQSTVVVDHDGPGPMPPRLYSSGAIPNQPGDPSLGWLAWHDGVTSAAVPGILFDLWHTRYGALLAIDTPFPGIAPGSLVVTGVFETTDRSVQKIGVWNGEAWSQLGPTPAPSDYLYAEAIIRFDPDGPGPAMDLIALAGSSLRVGSFTRAAAWDGLQWSPLGSPAFDIRQFEVLDLDGEGPDAARLLARSGLVYAWDGAVWTPLGSTFISAMTVHDPDGPGPQSAGLYGVSTSDGVQLLKWNGADWQVVPCAWPSGFGLNPSALRSFDADGAGPGLPSLVCAGSIYDFSSPWQRGSIAIAAGEQWIIPPNNPMDGNFFGPGDPIDGMETITPFDPDGPGPRGVEVIIGGGAVFMSGERTGGYVCWNGSRLGTFRAGIHGSWIHDFRVFDADGAGPEPARLYAAGRVAFVNAEPTGNLMVWQDGFWRGLGSPSSNYPRELESFDPDGDGPLTPMLIGSSSPGTAVLKWDGSDWTSLANPISGSGVYCVRAFDADGDGPLPPELFACGAINVSKIVRLIDNHWVAAGAPRWESVFWLEIYDEDGSGPLPPALIAVATQGLFRWTGSDWIPYAGNVSFTNTPDLTTTYRFDAAVIDADGDGPQRPELAIACTSANTPNGAFAGGAAFDGIRWRALGPARTWAARRIRTIDLDGPGPQAPRIVVGYLNGPSEIGVAMLENGVWREIGPYSTPEPLQFRYWAFAGHTPGVEGPAPNELFIGGSFYRAGGQPANLFARWRTQPCCDPDVNCDGSADQADIACIILAIAGDASCSCQPDPDFNLDGSADQGDVAALIGVVAGGECP